MKNVGFSLLHNLAIQRQGVEKLLEQIQPELLQTDEGKLLLASLQVPLLFHLRVEDKLLIPILDVGALHWPRIAAVMAKWDLDLRTCEATVQAFFQHWFCLDSPEGDLASEWESLRNLVARRMEIAEQFLYPAYQDISIKA